jgi:hypothetical protein
MAHAHALGLDPDRDLDHRRLARDVDHRDHVVVLVGDVDRLVVGRQDEQLGIGAGRQVVQDRAARRVHHLDRVVVGGADVEIAPVAAQRDAARPVADRHRLEQLERGAVDDADRVALLVRDEDLDRRRPADHAAGAGQRQRHASPPHHLDPPCAIS